MTLFDLLQPYPAALLYAQTLARDFDVWVVGGAARSLVYGLPFPNDVDLLLNNEKQPAVSLPGEPNALTRTNTSSGGQGQKMEIGGVKLDVFENGIVRWLSGVPCLGDCLAVRLSDGFILSIPGHTEALWTELNPRYNGTIRPDYLERHRQSLTRDQLIVQAR